MPQAQASLAGRKLARTYAVERLLGRGAMGSVFAARHLRTGGLVAVKILDPEAAAEEEIYRRFQNEARIVSALRHPHIVQVIDFDEDEDGTPFLVMELLEGQDLFQRMRQVGRLPVDFTLEMARQVGSALHAAHQLGVVHRDVKPQNIFLCRHQLGDRMVEVAKVVDFGISKIRNQSQQTQAEMVLGTPFYMSPEAAQAQNAELDGRADQWGLAVILYRALSGHLPFNNPDPLAVLYQVVNQPHVPLRAVAPHVPPAVAAAIERAMRKRKEERFPSMAEFVRALDGVPGVADEPGAAQAEEEYEALEVSAAGEPAAAPSITSTGNLPRRRARLPYLYYLAAVFSVMLLLLGTLLWVKTRSAGVTVEQLAQPAGDRPSLGALRREPVHVQPAPPNVRPSVEKLAPPGPADPPPEIRPPEKERAAPPPQKGHRSKKWEIDKDI